MIIDQNFVGMLLSLMVLVGVGMIILLWLEDL